MCCRSEHALWNFYLQRVAKELVLFCFAAVINTNVKNNLGKNFTILGEEYFKLQGLVHNWSRLQDRVGNEAETMEVYCLLGRSLWLLIGLLLIQCKTTFPEMVQHTVAWALQRRLARKMSIDLPKDHWPDNSPPRLTVKANQGSIHCQLDTNVSL